MKVPRVVMITRPTDYELLLAQHGTREQARFFLQTRGRVIDEVEARHRSFANAVLQVTQSIPTEWRRVHIKRSDLAQFVFEPEDIIAAVGQDGLVANVAKYLSGQKVIGFNPDPEWYPGVLVLHSPKKAARLLMATAAGHDQVQSRTMVEALLDNGQHLLALNEIFIGHISHQSARYILRYSGQQERHSSSGLIISTGTGATGWALSIHHQLHSNLSLPVPEASKLVFFVREPWPSKSTGTTLARGVLKEQESIEIISEMNDGGVLFGDGIEQDRIQLPFGVSINLRIAKERLRLVI